MFSAGVCIVIFPMFSIGSGDGIFSRILSLVSVPPTSELAVMQLCINVGILFVHFSFFLSLGISVKSILNAPERIDKWVCVFSLLATVLILLLWFVDGSYPVLYNTLELLGY